MKRCTTPPWSSSPARGSTAPPSRRSPPRARSRPAPSSATSPRRKTCCSVTPGERSAALVETLAAQPPRPRAARGDPRRDADARVHLQRAARRARRRGPRSCRAHPACAPTRSSTSVGGTKRSSPGSNGGAASAGTTRSAPTTCGCSRRCRWPRSAPRSKRWLEQPDQARHRGPGRPRLRAGVGRPGAARQLVVVSRGGTYVPLAATPMMWPSGSVKRPITRPSITVSGPITRVPPRPSAFASAASTSGTST